MSETEELKSALAVAVRVGRAAESLCHQQHALFESLLAGAKGEIMVGRGNRKRRELLLVAILDAVRSMVAEPPPTRFEWPEIEAREPSREQ
jgi:hypothetical protein